MGFKQSKQQIYDILRYSAITELDNGKTVIPQDTLYGWGRVDAFRAMLAITRGDANNNGGVDVGDAVYINQFIFQYGPAPKPDTLTGDANCSGDVNAADAVYIVNYIFKDGPPPPDTCFKY